MRKKIIPILIVLIIVVILAGASFAFWRFIKSRGVPEPPSQSPNQYSEEERLQRRSALMETIDEIFKNESPGTSYWISIYDINRNEQFGVDEAKPVHAASVSKILTAVYTLDQIEKGKASLSDPMGAYNLEFQLEKMINISNQESWDLIDERFSPNAQNTYAKSIGLKATDVSRGKNLMPVKDVGLLLKKLEKGEILSNQSRNRLFFYMKKTESENFFSPILEQSHLTFYHKTGKYEGEAHDAAIVEHEKNPFVLVVFTENNSTLDPNVRAPVMTSVATAVLEYFSEI